MSWMKTNDVGEAGGDDGAGGFVVAGFVVARHGGWRAISVGGRG